MSARGLSTTAWRRTWRDRLPPEWPAMVASFVLLIVLAVEVLRPDIVWRVFA